MGFFTYISGGNGRCLSCGKDTEIGFQTKLFYADADNSCAAYRPGDKVLIDGLGDFLPLNDWDESESLVLVFGDWDCVHCHFTFQCAKVVLGRIGKVSSGFEAEILSVEQFRPINREVFAGVHFVDDELALLLDSMDETQALAESPKQQFEAFRLLPLEQRITRILKGTYLWARFHGLTFAEEIQPG